MTVRLNILTGSALAFTVLGFGSLSPGAERHVHEIKIESWRLSPRLRRFT